MTSADEEVKAKPRRGWWRGAARQAGLSVLDQFYPPACPHCGAPVVSANHLCAACWRAMMPITRPLCPVLGLPLPVTQGGDLRSAEAIADPPAFQRARSAFVYDGVARQLLLSLKYADRPELARLCARAMAAACAELFDMPAVLVPVPLHPLKQWMRRYNQSVELARALGAVTGCRIETGLVRRRRWTEPQAGLNAAQRARNVGTAFGVDMERLARLGGQRVVIVDDVITTGATVRAIARALSRAGVAQIDVVSFARVVMAA